jgi:tetratricopeptide (TPR) repeat protein
VSPLTIVITTFVLIGWIISLCLHEFSHALVAYWGGDTTVKNKGYLTLNPLKYTDPLMSIILPLVFLVLGGLPLPGAAVYIDEKRLRNRWWRSAVALAGPLGSAIAAFILAYLWRWWLPLVLQDRLPFAKEFWLPLLFSLGFLVFLNLYVMLLNLLPIPPLDGYHILEPWLPQQVQQQFRNFGLLGLIILIVLLFNVPPLSDALFEVAFQMGMLLGVEPIAAITNQINYEFSSNRLILSILLLGLALPVLLPVSKSIVYINRGLACYKRGDNQRAIDNYNQAIRLNPNFALAYSNRGAARSNLGDNQGVIEDCNQAIHLNPYLALAYINRGLARRRLGDNQGAIEDDNQAIRLNPNNVIAYSNRSTARYYLGDNQGAIEDCNQAIRLKPNKASGYFARGAIRCYIGDNQGAIEDFTEAIRLDPNADRYYNRGVLHYQLGNYQESIADLTQTLQLQPNNVAAYYNRGNAKYDLGDESGAFQDYNQAQAIKPNPNIDPDDEHGYYGRGLARSRMGDNQGAREDLHKAAIICSEHRHTDLYQKVQEAINKLSD